MPYFVFSSPFVPHTKIKALDVDAVFVRIVTGFNNVEIDLDAAAAAAATALTTATTANASASAAVVTANSASTSVSAATSSAAAAAAAAAAASVLAGNALPKAGGTMTGAITLAADAAAALQPVSFQQMVAAINAVAPSGGGITSFQGRSTAAATLQGADITGLGSIFINAPNTFQIGATSQNTAGLGRIGNAVVLSENGASAIDSLRIAADHTAKVYLNNVPVFSIDATGTIASALTWNGDQVFKGAVAINNALGGGGYGGLLQFRNPAGTGPFIRSSPTNNMEGIKADSGSINWTSIDANGDFQTRGLIFANNTSGSGLGAIFPQAGGSPSGGRDGDIFLIY